MEDRICRQGLFFNLRHEISVVFSSETKRLLKDGGFVTTARRLGIERILGQLAGVNDYTADNIA